MKAICVMEPGRVEFIEKVMPYLQKDTEVLLKVRAVGICGSDIHLIHGGNPSATYPRIPGHEIVAEVVQTGSAVSHLTKGNRVIVEPIRYCGHCYACRKGQHNVCQELKVVSVQEDGGFQEYMTAEESMLYLLPDHLEDGIATLIEPYTIGFQANSRAGTKAGDVVLIHGAGPIGLVVLDIAKKIGATCIVSQTSKYRREMAKEFGADYVINPKEENLWDRIDQITEGMGANIIFEAAGDSRLLAESAARVSNAGTVVAMGFLNETASINYGKVTQKEVTIVGTRLQYQKFPEAIAYVAQHTDKAAKLLTHRFAFSEYEQALAVLADRNAGACKAVLIV